VLVILLTVAGIFIVQNAKSIGAMVADRFAAQAIDDLPVSEAERDDLKALMSELVDDFRSGNISMRELEAILDEVGSDPVIRVGAMAHALRTNTLTRLDLPPEELDGMGMTAMRFSRALAEDRLPAQVVGRVESDLTGIVEHGGPVSEERVRAVVEEMRAAADQAEMPAEPYEIDFSDVARAAIDRAVAKP
jgi:hypothetical protein